MRVMMRTLKELFKWWFCDSLWWTITSVLPIYNYVYIDEEEQYILSFLIVYIDVRLIHGVHDYTRF